MIGGTLKRVINLSSLVNISTVQCWNLNMIERIKSENIIVPKIETGCGLLFDFLGWCFNSNKGKYIAISIPANINIALAPGSRANLKTA